MFFVSQKSINFGQSGKEVILFSVGLSVARILLYYSKIRLIIFAQYNSKHNNCKDSDEQHNKLAH